MKVKYADLGLLLSVLLFTTQVVLGQTAQITGRVADSTNAVVPDAKITVRNVDKGIENPTATNESGYYTVPLLPPGSYEVTAQKPGFRPITRSGIKLEVQQVARIDFVMQVGEVTEQIDVVAGAPLVATDDAALGTLVDRRKILELPLNGRNALMLVTLAPGSTPNPRGPAATNVNGGRDNTADILIDGGATTSTDQGDARIIPPLEGVEEFKVQTGSFGAEFGRAGGVVNVVTKSGTNQLHGSLFEFLRNDAFDANNFFFNSTGQGKAKLRYNQFGGAIGGPVWLPKLYDGRNRTFFYFTYEGTRQVGQGLNQTTIPTALERAGDFSRSGPGGSPLTIYDPNTTERVGNSFVRTSFPNSRIPADRFHPVALRMLEEGYPLPNNSNQANNFIASGGRTNKNNTVMMRFDHNLTPGNRLSIRYLYGTNESENPQAWPGRPAQAGGTAAFNKLNTGRQHHAVISDTANLRANLLNEFTYSVLFTESLLNPVSAYQGWAQQLGIKNAAPFLFPTVSISGYSSLNGGNLSIEGDVNHQFGDNLTWIKGAHTLKTGFEGRPLYFRNFQPLGTAGSFTFDTQPTRNPMLSGAAAGGHGVASLLLGIPSNASLAVNDQKWGAFWRYYGGFIQDKWKINPRLTLDLGVRWEYTRPRKERWNRQSIFDLATQQLLFSGEAGVPETLFKGDFDNFAPRLGLAYAPFGNGKTAIRAAFGVYYLPINTLASLAQFSQGFTASQTFQTVDGGITFPLTLSEAFPFVPVTRDVSPLSSVSTIGPEYPTPQVNEWTLSVQHEIFANTLLDATYVGSKGTHLMISGRNLNQVPANRLGPGNAQSLRPFPNRGNIGYSGEPIGNSIYHGLQLKMEHRFSSGLSLLGWYTFQKSIDDASGFAGFRTVGTIALQDNHNFQAERSISTFDRTHNAVVAGLYELPFGAGKRFASGNKLASAVLGGWQINGILSLRSGVPLSMVTAQNLTGSLGGGSRPNRFRSGNLPESERSIQRWFDVSAFVAPPQFQFGNTSRTEPDVRGPGLAQLDFSLFRNVRFGEKTTLQFRAEAFNALNRVNFSVPNTTIGSSSAGIITGAGDARTIQFGARLSF